ncbi:Retrotransposable element Tf2 protein [Rhizoctonia solani]|uniref:Retrotransposable element Tf2 protein n=1 Tax=Rhizoctonia solani TaxID=456999 RepID=A0A8H8NPM7_9AGAM|nr:Retrotransposable element Tf2 protein [Rhizoctonia solani]QRW17584.1 Retrotransposable element Tf2 protein [Rhizoctonia solani]
MPMKVMTLDKLKIQAVQEWPVPTKVKEVQSFLGIANFLRQFVANFSHMARPLHNLVKKNTPWKWDTKEQEAFQGLKDAITNAPNYNTPNKELLAIICSFEYWRMFLEGTEHPITIFTDHWNLEYWKESQTFNQQHAQWHLLLAGYNFHIVYRPGKQSVMP